MSKIVDKHYLESLKEQHDLVKMVREQVPELKAMGGGDWAGPCPFHEEKTASFRVNRSRFHCFGCHVHGDLFSWVMRMTGKTFPQAVTALSKEGFCVPRHSDVEQRSIPNHTPYDAEAVERILDLNSRVQAYFDLGLGDGTEPSVRDYAELRFSSSACNAFGLGYADPESGLIDYVGHHGLATSEEMVLAGATAQSSDGTYYARLRDRITIPLRDRGGYIRGFVGRIIPRKDNLRYPKYVNPPTTKAFEKKRYLFNLDKLNVELKYAIVVEGPVDCISLTDKGIRNVVSCMGCDLSQMQLDILSNLVPRIFIMFDGDGPGLAGTVKAMKKMHETSAQLISILLTDDLDPDTWIGTAAHLPSPLKSLPMVKAVDYHRDCLVMKNITRYDRSQLDELIQPYVLDNIRKGWPQLNVVDFVMQAYPEHSAEIRDATLKLMQDSDELPDGRKKFKEENIKAFIRAWMKPSRAVRKIHDEQQTKRGAR